MGAMAQFLPLVLEKLGRKVSEKHSRQIRLFVDTMSFYARRDIDKSKAEDKHLFRVDEVMSICASAELKVEFLSNLTFERFSESSEPEHLVPDGFHVFFRDYLRYCMSFDEELVRLFDSHFSRYSQFIETLSGGGGGPYMHGVFLCRKG